jgi:hypothetical protein
MLLSDTHSQVVTLVTLLLSATMSSSQSTPQAPRATPQEQTTFAKIFRIDPASGAPTPLEDCKIKSSATRYSSGFLFLEGQTSPVAFKAAEPQVFVIRLMSPEDKYGVELTTEQVRKRIELQRLNVGVLKRLIGDKPVRYLTKPPYIPLDVQPYGQVALGLDPKKPNRAAQSFQLTPHVALPPGEYGISITGMHNFELVNRAAMGFQQWAFGIAPR